MNIVGIWPNIDRAFEIAYVGNLNVNVYWHPDYNGKEDFKHIVDTYTRRGITHWVHKDEDLCMNVELYRPEFEAVGTSFDNTRSLELSQIRLNKYMPTEVSKTGLTMLKVAYDKLQWGITRKDYCIRVAAAIAKLEGSQTIEAMHIAESVQYMQLPEYE